MTDAQPLQMDLFGAACGPGGPPTGQGQAPGTTPQAEASSGPGPTLGLCVLGSGSGGNVTLLTCTPAPGVRPSAILIDAGLAVRETVLRLHRAGFMLEDLSGICVTHFDTDHFRRSWVKPMVELGLPLFCHRRHLEDLRKVQNNQQLEGAGLLRPFDEHADFRVAPHISASAICLAHDLRGTSGFRFSLACGTSVGFATDLGHAPEALCRHVAGVDVLCIESNYDVAMTHTSSRPTHVNERNLSDCGHLSNEQALAAVQRVNALSAAGNPRKVVLLHRSSDCNDAKQVRRCFGRDPALRQRVVLTEQDRAAPWVRLRALPAVRREQQTLAGTD